MNSGLKKELLAEIGTISDDNFLSFLLKLVKKYKKKRGK